MALADAGWVWEGSAFDPGLEPTIYGVGEGAQYFGLKRACFMFHRNTPVNLAKLAALDQVVCDVTKWQFREVHDEKGRVAVQHNVSGDPAVSIAEAENVSRLSRDFPNITGAMLDDLGGFIKNNGYTPERVAQIRAALKQHNDALQLWAVVYSHELDPDFWKPYLPSLDLANLWVWESKNLPHLDEYVETCRRIFPGKPLVLGCYLRDYTLRAGVPMDLLQSQFERVSQYLSDGRIDGFSILAACLIDQHPDQAQWIRSFLAHH